MMTLSDARTIRVRGVDLAVRESGAGRAFVWGHGLLSSMAQEDATGVFDWSGTAAVARLVRYDARGHGRSRGSADPDDYRWPALAADMLGVADAVGAGRAVLGGASMGAASALHAAVASPDRVEGLVLVIPPTAWATRPRQARLYRVGTRVVETVGLRPLAVVMRALPPVGPLGRDLARVRDAMLSELAGADARLVARVLRGAAASDLPPLGELARLEVPTLVLAWRGDPGHPVATADELGRALPGAAVHRARTPGEVRDWPGLVRAFLADL